VVSQWNNSLKQKKYSWKSHEGNVKVNSITISRQYYTAAIHWSTFFYTLAFDKPSKVMLPCDKSKLSDLLVMIC